MILGTSAFSDAATVARLVHSIKRYAARPLFVGVNHETVEAVAQDSGFSSLPSARGLRASADIELSRHVGEVRGRELREVGVDITLGPRVDVMSHSDATDQSMRFDAERVARLCAAFIEGQQSEGVAASAAHFPGYGDAGHDGGRHVPHLPYGVARLEDVELRPFRAAATARVAGMVVGHIRLDALDDKAPASLSRAIIFGLLRQKLGYRGLLMIDDVESRALTERYSRDVIARLGVASSADCFLCVRRPETAFELIDAIERGVRAGAILPERVESARRRIAPVLHRYVRDPEPALSRLVESAALNPGVNATSHVGPGSPAADKKQYRH